MWVIAKPFKIRKQYTGHDRGEDKKEATPVSYAAPPTPRPRPNLTKDPLMAVSIWKSYIWTSDKDPKSERPDSRGRGLKREKLAVIASGAEAYPNSLHQKCLWVLSPPPARHFVREVSHTVKGFSGLSLKNTYFTKKVYVNSAVRIKRAELQRKVRKLPLVWTKGYGLSIS